MKIISINKITLGIACVLALTSGIFSSCLKDSEERYDKGPAVVSFQYTGNSQEVQTASLLGNASDSFNLEVTLSVPTLTLTTPVSVTISPYQQGLDSFNSTLLAADSDATTYTLLPSTLYSLPNGGVATINPGVQILKYKISFAGNTINFADTSYALVLHMTTASGATIASNLSTAIMVIKLKNPYEGDYKCTGYFVHPSSPRAINQAGFISTVSVIRSQAPLGDLGGQFFQFDTDASTGAVSNWSPAGSASTASGFLYNVDNAYGNGTYPGAPYTSANYPNKYDAATATFSLHYGYNGVSPKFSREIYEKYQLQ